MRAGDGTLTEGRRRRLALSVVVLGGVFAVGVAVALAVGGPVVKASRVAHLGRVVVDAKGRTLYHLTSEHGRIDCNGVCLRFWIPVLAAHGKPVAGPGLKASRLGTVRRPHGVVQVTYYGYPLYHYYLDHLPGQARGEGLAAATGTWYAVSPTGGRSVFPPPVGTTTDTSSAPTTTTSMGGY
jgi:predicted lipoprotein with Yx(FWY)xxD motif